ncbi:glycosyltransferase [Pseudokineococcus basanitobsidens]|uniref:Glycosyltransferase n=1 Tax=Pseudokineococcus basanitobsidens TaxID=1926649 RepID=A0ABU8RH74_9ACTN
MSVAGRRPPVLLVVPGDLDAPTGGTVYDRRLAGALADLGVDVRVVPVEGAWPRGSARDRRRLAEVLADARGPVLVDGLVGAGAPEALEAATAAGAAVHLLLHLPLALEHVGAPGSAAGDDVADLVALEDRALAAVRGVVVTSRWAAEHLASGARAAGGPVVVAEPGTDPAAPARGSTPPFLLQLATLSPRKAQDVVVAALAEVVDLPWTAALVGDDAADPGYALGVRSAVAAAGLEDRVALTGPLAGAALEAVRSAADLVLAPSHAETWGMAVAEGLARGVPAVVGAGTGTEEVLGVGAPGSDAADPPGAVVAPGDPAALAAALRRLLEAGGDPDGPLGRARSAARRRGAGLAGWDHTARRVAEALGVVP